MKKVLTALLVCLSSLVYAQSTTVVISQVYGAGGNNGAIFNADFVELHNVSSVSQSLAGYSLQYGSSGNQTWSASLNLPSVVIPAGGFYLIKMSDTTTTGQALPFPDLIANPAIGMGGSAGKVALVSDTNRLSSASCPTSAQVIDMVGYGSATLCKETSPTANLSSALAAIRNNNGCTDTDNNLADFTLAAPNPRNSSTTPFICGTSPTNPSISTTSLPSFGFVCLSLNKTNFFILNGTNLNGSNIDLASLNGMQYSLSEAGPFNSALSITATGGSFSDTIFVRFTPTAAISYNGNIVITGGGISAAVNVAVTANGLAAAAPTVSTKAATNVTKDSALLNSQIVFTNCDTVTSYGFVYSTDSNFVTADTLNASNLSSNLFSLQLAGLTSGTTYYFKAFAQNANGRSYDSLFRSFTTTRILPPGGSAIRISQIYGAGGNTGAKYQNDFIELHNNSAVAESLAGFSIQYTSANGTSWGTSKFDLPNASIPGGGYFLIKLSGGANGSPLPVVADATGSINLSGKSGKVVLVNGTTALGQDTCPTVSAVIDFVGYGLVNCSEGGSPADTLTAITALFRKNNGCTDTDNNKADFDTLAPAPRNSATAPYFCGGAPVPTISASALQAFGTVCVNTTAGPLSFTLTGSQLTTDNIKVAALTGYSYATSANGTYADSLVLTQPGGAYSQTIYVKFTPVAANNYNGNIVISGGGIASPVNVAATGLGSAVALPAVTNKAATAITKTSATLNASLVAGGCSPVLQYGFAYSDVSGFIPSLLLPASNLSAGNYSLPLSALVKNKTYYFKAYATTASDTIFASNELSFTTLNDAPSFSVSVTSLNPFPATCVGAQSAEQSFKLTGTDLSNANVQVGPLTGFKFASTANGTYSDTLFLTLTIPNATADVFVKFVPVATNNYAGNISVTGGGVASSVTVAASGEGINTPPTVNTGGSSNISSSGATLSGTVDEEGCSAVVERGIEYSTTSGFSSGTQVKDNSTPNSVINVNVSNLSPATTYYYKAFAKNANGVTDYGDEESFETLALSGGTGVTVVSNPVSRGGYLRFNYAPSDLDRYIVRLYNMAGQIVFEKTFDNQQPNELRRFEFLMPGNLAPGLHTLMIGNSKGNIKTSIMIL